MPNISLQQKKELIEYWNNYFNADVNTKYHNTITPDELFNNYLDELYKVKQYDFYYCDKVCMVLKDKGNTIVKSYNKQEVITSRKQLFDITNKYEIIISDFPFVNGMRKKCVENLFTSNHTHFFDKTLPFSYNNDNVFFTVSFYEALKNKLETIKFNSKLLNHFEIGTNYNKLEIKPTINISEYGRWYWNGCKIQNNKTTRDKLISYLDNLGKVYTVDITAAEPTMFSKITKSELIPKLIMLRNNTSKEYSDMIKNILNIYIHSVLTPEQSYTWLKKDNKEICNKFEKEFGISILDIYKEIYKETNEYNKYVINEYKKNMAVAELNRRMINPISIIQDDKTILKQHRNYLQGHVQDMILNIIKELCDENKISIDNVIWTIFDSFSVLLDDNCGFEQNIKDISNKFNILIHLE